MPDMALTIWFGMADLYGALAQLGERLHGMQEVSGSIPLGSTIFLQLFARPSLRMQFRTRQKHVQVFARNVEICVHILQRTIDILRDKTR